MKSFSNSKSKHCIHTKAFSIPLVFNFKFLECKQQCNELSIGGNPINYIYNPSTSWNILSIPLLSSFSSTLLLGSVAIMTKAYPNVERNELILLQEIATYMLLACGAVYIIAVSLQSFGNSCFIYVSIYTYFLLFLIVLNVTLLDIKSRR